MHLFELSSVSGILLPPAIALAVLGILTTAMLLRDHVRLERHCVSLKAEGERLRAEIRRLTGQGARDRAHVEAFSNNRAAPPCAAHHPDGNGSMADSPARARPDENAQPRPSSSGREPRDLGVQRILLAEDDDTNALLALNALRTSGADIDWAKDGQEAVSMVEKAFSDSRPYDVVLMDLRMPRLDGYEATQCIRAMEAKRQLERPTRIVAVTATTMRRDRIAAKQAGVDAFLPKPYRTDSLRQLLSPC